MAKIKAIQKKISSSPKKQPALKQVDRFTKVIFDIHPPIPSSKVVKKHVKKKTKTSTIPVIRQRVKKVRPVATLDPFPSPLSPAVSPEIEQQKIFVDHTDIPTFYEKTWLALIVKDPHWVYATWEISQHSLQPFLSQLEDSRHPAKIILRMYDVTCIQFDGHNANHYFDLEVGRSANNWYINLWTDHASTCAEIGVRAFDGNFTPLARSNFVQTPRASYSWRTEQIWMEVKDHETQSAYVVVRIPRDNASRHQSRNGVSKTIRRKFYLTAEDIRGYYAQLMPFFKKVLSTRWRKETLKRYRYILFEENDLDRNEIYRLAGEEFFEKMTAGASEILVRRGKRGALGASEHLSASQPLEKKQRNFFFEIWADVIIYGRTEANAEVWLKNQKIHLRSDGTFTLRYTLPDTTIPMEFTAVSADKLEQRSITTVVNRQTEYFLPVMLAGKIS